MTATTRQLLAFACGLLTAALVAGGWFAYQSRSSPGSPARQRLQDSAGPAPVRQPERAPVTMEAAQVRALGLQVASVTKNDLVEDLKAVATVVPDESRISHIHTRVAGWIEKLHVSNTGEPVRAGQPIADIFSQELFASQVEYLAARAYTGPPSAVAESGRTRLKFFGMSERDIQAIEKSGEPQRVVTLAAPRSGILAHRGISAGTAVDPSTEIAIVLDLSRVWVFAEVPEFAAANIRKGMVAQLEFGTHRQTGIPATVEFIDPILTEATRTLKVRFSVPNAQGGLRPGMYGTAVFKLPSRQGLTVPRDAVVDTGSVQYVYVVKADGAYEPRAVRVGARLQEKIEILEGLREADKVVSSGVFLLDSESRLRASGGQGTSHGGHGAPAPGGDKAAAKSTAPANTEHAAHD